MSEREEFVAFFKRFPRSVDRGGNLNGGWGVIRRLDGTVIKQ